MGRGAALAGRAVARATASAEPIVKLGRIIFEDIYSEQTICDLYSRLVAEIWEQMMMTMFEFE